MNRCPSCGDLEVVRYENIGNCMDKWHDPNVDEADKNGNESLIVHPDQFTESDYRRVREILVQNASGPGRPRPHTANDNLLPEEISQYSGLDDELARTLRELFPAPNPDIVASRRLRKIGGYGPTGHFSVGVVIPKEILFVTGMRLSDLVLISGWASGIIRVVRLVEGK